MIETQHPYPGQGDSPLTGPKRDAFIGRQVVGSLGTPDELVSVKVHHLGRDNYRVNVVVGKDINSSRIADSFFLTTDELGNIVGSSPKIVRMY
jgi:hypothetical protein